MWGLFAQQPVPPLPATGVKRQSGCTALPSTPISGSLCFRNKTRMLQNTSSCKRALLPLSPPGKTAEQGSPPWHILAGELREGKPSPWAGQKGWGVAASAQLVWPVPNFPQLLPLPQRALGGDRLSPSCDAGPAAPGTMPVFLRWPGQLLAAMVLVLQPAGSRGECRSPACFLCFCGSALLTDQICDDRVSKIQWETFPWLKSLLISCCA